MGTWRAAAGSLLVASDPLATAVAAGRAYSCAGSAQQNNSGIGLENTGTNDNIVEDNTAIGNTNDYSGGGADCRIAPAPVAGRALARDNVVKSARFSSTATA